jgi:GntR family transcriptional regulator
LGPAGEATAELLGLRPSDEVLSIQKVFREDDEPVIVTTNRIPISILVDTDYEDDEAVPLFEFVEEHCDRVLEHYVSEIIPVALDPNTAAALGVDAGTPAICFDEVGFDQSNEPIVRATSFFRDDLLRFRMIRRRARA